MIVKNEAPILERSLRAVAPWISHFVICDTGSTDGTPERIKEILHDVPGEVHLTEFGDFSRARNEALERGRNTTADYLLLCDADMELQVEDPHWHENLTAPAYQLRQVSGDLGYYNVRLVKKDAEARYVGATHEYLEVTSSERLSGAWYLDHACGSSRPQKIERDTHLLEQDLRDKPGDSRTLFYLAQTHRDAKRYQDALERYQERVEAGGWAEEAWYARYQAARCLQHLNDERCPAAYLEAYSHRPTRAEPLYALALHYRERGLHDASLAMCELGERIPLPDDLLFVEEEIYRYGFREAISISGYYSQLLERRERGRRLCHELCHDPTVPPHIREVARSNMAWYVKDRSE